MIILQIIVAAIGAKEQWLAMAQAPLGVEESKLQEIPVTDEELRLLASHAAEVLKEVLRQEEDKE
jgi:hypothetical protein